MSHKVYSTLTRDRFTHQLNAALNKNYPFFCDHFKRFNNIEVTLLLQHTFEKPISPLYTVVVPLNVATTCVPVRFRYHPRLHLWLY